MALAGASAAQKVSTQDLLQMARTRSAGLEQALLDSLGAENIQKGTAAAGEMGDFVWAVVAEKGPSLQINNEPPVSAFKAGSLWVVETRLNTGTAYKYTWIVDGKPIGGANNLPASALIATPSLTCRRASSLDRSQCRAKYIPV
jgi:hypothetical protein